MGYVRKSIGDLGFKGLEAFLAKPRVARRIFWDIAESRFDRDSVDEDLEFLAFCSGMSRYAHGQLLQDLWVLSELSMRRSGFFVEFGAADGVRHSNTFLLEKEFQWSGILSEPNPAMRTHISASRSAFLDTRCVWERTGNKLELAITEDPEFSFAVSDAGGHAPATRPAPVSTAVVPTVSLNDMLLQGGAPGRIDYMSIDTEGSELQILETFDFSAWDVRLMTVEHNFRADEAELDLLLGRAGYERCFQHLSRWDGWYRKIGVRSERKETMRAERA